jgi:protein-S-isoprenylcysteine O-methyltransferase Ste14
MNIIKTFLYMGSMHGFFTYYFPWQIASHDPGVVNIGLLRWLAVPLWGIGTLILLHCSIDIIRKGYGTPAHLDPPKALVVTGLYRYVRNPIYLGSLLIQLGTILWFGSSLLIPYFLFFTIAYHILIVFFEEPVLYRLYGSSYEEYVRKVPRWIPGLRDAGPK